jgi:hypothetical protein
VGKPSKCEALSSNPRATKKIKLKKKIVENEEPTQSKPWMLWPWLWETRRLQSSGGAGDTKVALRQVKYACYH